MQQIMDGNNTIYKKYPKQHYSIIFNKSNGFFARIEDNGFSEPLWSEEGPELLDISITNYCERGCSFCYRKSNVEGNHISVEDYTSIIKQAKKIGVLQIALGGGNPNQHPSFIDIIRITAENGIVPSYTSNGDGLTDNILKASKKYCGAIALSAYKPYDELAKKINFINKYDIKLNIHFMLDKNTINQAINWLMKPPAFLKQNINAIIFLNYKPIHSSETLLLKYSDRVNEFFKLINNNRYPFKIGFDSCTVSGIVNHMKVNSMYYESCESARFSAFISEDMKMYPCSFMVDTEKYGDIRKFSIQEVWQTNANFQEFRKIDSQPKCSSCKNQKLCNGGCKFLPTINLCDY